MPLFQRRQKEREKAERVAAGEAIAPTRSFDERCRTRIAYAIMDAAPEEIADSWTSKSAPEVFAAGIKSILRREWGVVTLAGKSEALEDFNAFLIGLATDDQMPDVIEAVFAALDQVNSKLEYRHWDHREADAFRDTVNRILDEHDVAYQVVGKEVLPRESMAMYSNVVAPALSLLHGAHSLEKVERAFHDALRELKPGGNPGDAITDAGTALQEMLVALGAEGNALGPLLTSARSKGLLGPYDSKLADGMKIIGDWVSADRSTRGDAHSATDADIDDAWLAVHVAAALIVRLEKRIR